MFARLENHFGTNETIILPTILYVLFLAQFCYGRNAITGYFGYHKGVSHRDHHQALRFHASAGVLELVLYYAGSSCSPLAVILTFVHSITGLALAKNLRKGHPSIVRPVNQAGNLMRMPMILYAYHSQSPLAYHEAIVPLHSFVYTRALIFLVATMGPGPDLGRNANDRSTYTAGAWGAAFISMSHSKSPYGILMYLVLWHLTGQVSRWTRLQLDTCSEQGVKPGMLITGLEYVGLYSLPVSKFLCKTDIVQPIEVSAESKDAAEVLDDQSRLSSPVEQSLLSRTSSMTGLHKRIASLEHRHSATWNHRTLHEIVI